MSDENPPTQSIVERSAEDRSELSSYLHARAERRRILPWAAVVGLLAGAVSVAFRVGLAGADLLRLRLIAWAHGYPTVGWIFPALFAAAGALAAIYLVRKAAPEAAGSGIPHLEAVLRRHRTMNVKRILPTKFFGGLFAIGGGLCLGREGPTVQMGGATGMGVGKRLKMSPRETLTLAAAGSGAGLAAAFNAPLSGLVFVLEELQRDFRPVIFAAAFLAAACADVVTRLFSGQLPDFAVPAYAATPLTLLPVFAVLGIGAGVAGVVFNRSLVASLNAFAGLSARKSLIATAAVGVLVGIVGYANPNLIGGGHALAEQALAGRLALGALPIFFLARFGLTMGSYGSGAPGGIFAPLLALGALLGLACGQLLLLAVPHLAVQPGVFAVVGMAALFTAIVRAPLTGIVLIIEMTQSYAQMLPLLVSCFAAYAVAEAMGDLPVYESLLQRDLLRGGKAINLEEPIVLELEIHPGAPFEDRRVRDLGLPAGVVLVGCRDGEHESVPTADTVLRAHVRVTAVISPQASGGLESFREGCGG